MKYLKITIDTCDEAEDIIIADLAEIGIEGAQIEDDMPLEAEDLKSLFVDIAPQSRGNSGTARLHFFIEMHDDGSICASDTLKQSLDSGQEAGVASPAAIKALIEERLRILSAYADLGNAAVTLSETDDIDWVDNWKRHFHQFAIGDVLVVPLWEEIPANSECSYILHINPGAAFGTGLHETTRLCIEALQGHVREGDIVLDIGSGSGILSIAARLFGAGQTVMLDIDPLSIESIRENLRANEMPLDDSDVILGDIISDASSRDAIGAKSYDIIVANILAETLVEIIPIAAPLIRPGGCIVTSGILNEEPKIKMVKDTLEANDFKEITIRRQGEWAAIIGYHWDSDCE